MWAFDWPSSVSSSKVMAKATKSQSSQKIFCLFYSLWYVHKPNFILIPWATPKLLGQKKTKVIITSNNSCIRVYSHFWYFINTFAAGCVGKNPQFSMFLSNCTTRQAIVLEGCSNPRKTQQVFESALKKNWGFWVLCEWCHKWGGQAFLAHFILHCAQTARW